MNKNESVNATEMKNACDTIQEQFFADEAEWVTENWDEATIGLTEEEFESKYGGDVELIPFENLQKGSIFYALRDTSTSEEDTSASEEDDEEWEYSYGEYEYKNEDGKTFLLYETYGGGPSGGYATTIPNDGRVWSWHQDWHTSKSFKLLRGDTLKTRPHPDNNDFKQVRITPAVVISDVKITPVSEDAPAPVEDAPAPVEDAPAPVEESDEESEDGECLYCLGVKDKFDDYEDGYVKVQAFRFFCAGEDHDFDTLDGAIEAFLECFVGCYDSNIEFAREQVDMYHDLEGEVPDFIYENIDWRGIADYFLNTEYYIVSGFDDFDDFYFRYL